MRLGSSKYLSVLARHGGYIEREALRAADQVAQEVLSLKSGMGEPFQLGAGRSVGLPATLPRHVFEDFLAARWIKQDAADPRIYRLTADGRRRGLEARPSVTEH